MFPIKDIMTKNVLTVCKETPIEDAINLMANHKISGIPVVNADKQLTGILSEHDVLGLLTDSKCIEEGAKVKDFMTVQVIGFHEKTSAIEIAEYFKTNFKRRVPVTNDAGKLVGVISRHDIIKLIVNLRKKLSDKE